MLAGCERSQLTSILILRFEGCYNYVFNPSSHSVVDVDTILWVWLYYVCGEGNRNLSETSLPSTSYNCHVWSPVTTCKDTALFPLELYRPDTISHTKCYRRIGAGSRSARYFEYTLLCIKLPVIWSVHAVSFISGVPT